MAFARVLFTWLICVGVTYLAISNTEKVVMAVATMQGTTSGSSVALGGFTAGSLPASLWRAGVITAAVTAAIPAAYALFSGNLGAANIMDYVLLQAPWARAVTEGTGGASWASEGIKLLNLCFPLDVLAVSVGTVIGHRLLCQSIILGLSSAIRWVVG